MAADDTDAAPRAARPSAVPSWILLGFAIGALFVLLLRREYLRVLIPAALPPPAVSEPTPETLTARHAEPSLSAIEALWEVWGEHAVWEGDVTEVALWNTRTLSFADCFEVARRGDRVYFRVIPRLTRPVIDRGLGAGAPVQFTSPASRTKR
jgi:hypothetical protein